MNSELSARFTGDIFYHGNINFKQKYQAPVDSLLCGRFSDKVYQRQHLWSVGHSGSSSRESVLGFAGHVAFLAPPPKAHGNSVFVTTRKTLVLRQCSLRGGSPLLGGLLWQVPLNCADSATWCPYPPALPGVQRKLRGSRGYFNVKS